MKRAKRILAVALCLLMTAALFAGCEKAENKSGLDSEAVVLTVGETKVPLRVPYFVLKWQQASYQAMASSFYGEDWYNQDLEGNGETFLDYIKSSVIASMTDMYLCRQQAEEMGLSLTEEEQKTIDGVVKDFLNSNTEEAQAAMMADEDTVRTVMENYTLYSKVYNQVVQDADTSVTEEEARQASYSYIYQELTSTDEEGNKTEYTDSQKQKYYNDFAAVATAVKNGTEFDQAASDAGYSPASHTYTVSGDEDDTFVDINKVANQLKVGEVSDLIPVEGGLFLICLDTDNDQEATEQERQSMASEKQTAYFEDWIAPIREKASADLDEDLWGKVDFEEPIAVAAENEE